MLRNWTVRSIELKDMTSHQYRRISQEFIKLQNNIEPEWLVESYYPNDLSRWRLYLSGRHGTPYENGIFQLSVTFPLEYPFTWPEFRFDTKMFHPNIHVSGMISYPFDSDYPPTTPIRRFLQAITSAIYLPNTDYFIDENAAFLFDHDVKLFELQATFWTRKYATDAEIMSSRSYSPPPSGIISPEINSPNSVRARSPCRSLWLFQPISNSREELIEQWQSYTKDEEFVLERAYRSGISQIELGSNSISFSYGTQVDENGNISRVKRNVLKTTKLRRRHRCLAFYNGQFSVEDPIITDCLVPSVNTNIAAVITGILYEGTLKNKKLQAENLVQQLQTIDETDTVLIGLQCIKLYTCDSFLSKSLNMFLRKRDRTRIDTLGPFCKLLYSQFNKYRSDIESLKVYRGENLRAHELRAYKRATGKGSYQWFGFTSTSKSPGVAKIFVRNAYFIIRLEKLYNDGRALDINKLSNFDEDEVLLRPGVEFSIDKFEYNEDSKIYTFYLIAYI